MRNFRSLVLGLVLVILSPLGWGEDVYYCVEEHNVALRPTDSGDAYELKRFKEEKFTFKYEAGENRLAVSGWGEELYYLDCRHCIADIDRFHATDGLVVFALSEGRFNSVGGYYSSADAGSGTCTKF